MYHVVLLNLMVTSIIFRAYVAYSEKAAVDPSLETAERALYNDYQKKLLINDAVIPDPLLIKEGWTGENNGKSKWPSIYYQDISRYMSIIGSEFIARLDREYKVGKAYRYFSNDLVREIFIHNISPSSPYCILRCRVIHSQSMNSKPYFVWIICTKDKDAEQPGGEIKSGYCSCTAGMAGMCNHVIAMLFRIENAVVTGATKPSKTSQKCTWTVPSGTKVDLTALPATQITWQKTHYTKEKQKDLKVEQDAYLSFSASLHESHLAQLHDKEKLREKLFKSMKNELGTSRISELITNKRLNIVESPNIDVPESIVSISETFQYDQNKTLEENIDIFKQKITVSDKQIKDLAIVSSKQSETPIWQQQRKGRITASNFYRVCTKMETLDKKTNANTKPLTDSLLGIAPFVETKALKHGKAMEPKAKQKYIAVIKNKHKKFKSSETGLVLLKDYSYIGASPDLVVNCDCCGHGLAEIKCPYSICSEIPTALNLPYLELVEDAPHLKVRSAYFYQIQGQMAVTNTLYCDFFVYTKFGYHLERIMFSRGKWEEMFGKLSSFWLKYLAPLLVQKKYSFPTLQTPTKHMDEDLDSLLNDIKDIHFNVDNLPTSSQFKVASSTLQKANKENNAKSDMKKRKMEEYLCGFCNKELSNNPKVYKDFSIQCDKCDIWFHFPCANISKSVNLDQEEDWYCLKCLK